MKTIKITVAKDGTTRIEANGYTDSECHAATAAIEKALGSVTERKEKDQRFESAWEEAEVKQ